MWWLPRFKEAGFVVTPLGLPAIVENAWTMAALIEIQQSTLDTMVERTGQASVLFHRDPQLDAIARARLCMTTEDARQRV